MHRDAFRLQQAHPAKLVTDAASALAAFALLWSGHAALGIVALVAPPFVATAFVLARGDLDALAQRPLGRGVVKGMVPLAQGARLAGLLVAAAGAWMHQPWEIVVGLLLALGAWIPSVRVAMRG